MGEQEKDEGAEQEVHEAADALGVDDDGKDAEELVDELKTAQTDSAASPTGADPDQQD